MKEKLVFRGAQAKMEASLAQRGDWAGFLDIGARPLKKGQSNQLWFFPEVMLAPGVPED